MLKNNFNIIIFSGLLFFFGINIYASRLDELMEKGNSAFQNEQYEEALRYYNEILNEGYVSYGLHYNLGNTYFRLNQLGLSILNYERALKLSPNDEDVLYNLNIVKARTKDRIKEVPEIFITQWWNTIISTISPKGWSILVIGFYLILLVLIVFWLFTKSPVVRQSVFYLGFANIFLLLICVLFLFTSIQRENSNKYGVLLTEEITAKLSPDSDSGDAFLIHEGVKFEIEDELMDWAEIKLPDGKVGWLPKVSFDEI